MVKLSGSGSLAHGFGVGGTRSGRGFAIQFDRKDSEKRTRDILEGDAVVIRGASIEAVVKTTNEVKLRIRAYINAHFTGSEVQSNNNRKAANASAQSKFYNDVADKGQYTGLVYSKFGKRDGAQGFVDYLLLHMRGGVVKPSQGGWLRIVNKENAGLLGKAQSGFFENSQSTIFFSNSADGKKLFQLRRYKKGSFSGKAGKTELIATLLRQVIFPARLTGIDEIARSRADLFDGYFKAAFDARQVGEA